MNERISVYVSTRDRSMELYGLLVSLLNQSYKNFDVIIGDGSAPNSILGHHSIQSVCQRLKLEGHGVFGFSVQLQGVCHSRQECIEKDPWKTNELCLRIDDDTIIPPNYIEKLLEGIHAGYDLVSGLTPHCASPEVMRETRFVKPIMNKIEIDAEGNIVKIGDDQALTYDTEEIIPTHHFRSSALYKRKIHDVFNYKLGLTPVGFREELWMSIRAILAGYKLAVHTGAKYWHLITSSGGCRFPNYAQMVQTDEAHMRSCCLLYTSPSPRDGATSRMPSSA